MNIEEGGDLLNGASTLRKAVNDERGLLVH
jgi:hypothetical protein